MAKRYTRKELRRPDEFVSFWQRAYNLLQGAGRPIVIGAVVAIAVIGGANALSSRSQSRESDASRALSHAMKVYAADLATDDEALKKLQQQEEDVPRYKSVDERRQATLAELDDLLRKQPGAGAAVEARLVRAGVLLDGGKWDEAITAYGDFLAQVGTDHRLRFLAREGRGYAYEGKGQLDQALNEFSKLEGEGDLSKDRAQYHQARILEKKGDAKGAEKLYQAVLEKFPSTNLRDEIGNRLAALEAR